jgi:hypothetical protein
MTLVTFLDTTPKETVEELVSHLLVVAHHPRLSSVEASFWIEMVMHAKISPDQLIATKLNELLELIWVDASLTPSVSSCRTVTQDPSADSLVDFCLQSKPFATAAYHAATTLALVRPAEVVPALFTQIEDDLLPAHLDFIGAEEFGIWGTPEGTTFVDGKSLCIPFAFGTPLTAFCSFDSARNKQGFFDSYDQARIKGASNSNVGS